jgi:hypothetical protein
MKYIITTTRTEYQTCRYTVEASSVEEAEELFDDGEAEELSSDTVDAFESVDDISPHSDSASESSS